MNQNNFAFKVSVKYHNTKSFLIELEHTRIVYGIKNIGQIPETSCKIKNKHTKHII